MKTSNQIKWWLFSQKDERFQLLHHAYIYNFEKVALVVGAYTGKIINATIVSFDNEFLESYGNVIQVFKDNVLDWTQWKLWCWWHYNFRKYC